MAQVNQRDLAPDVLRGFALLGILIVNIPYMAISSGDGLHNGGAVGFANGSAAMIVISLFLGKFYLLFSFLFGYSSNYILKNERSNRGRWVKRCLALMAIGVLHGTLLWHAEIIFVYGLLGLLLIPFFFRADRTLKIWTRVVYSIFAVIFLALSTILFLAERYFLEEISSESFASKAGAKLDDALRGGTFIESVSDRFALWLETVSVLVFLQGGLAFAAFLLGLQAARKKFLTDEADRKSISKMLRFGFVLGLPIQLIIGAISVRNEQATEISEGIYLATTGLALVAAPLLSMGYVGLILKLISERSNWVAWMKPAGRMSLTVYISQSLIALMIFAPWGLGLFGELELWRLMPIAIAISLILVYFATVWMARFSQGPLEWVVNSLTKKR